jgi:methylmalonyl-CoA/ethylmalonyl-CoA epimerase
MISRIDHVSIAVKDYKKAYNFFTKVLGAIPGAESEDPRLKYRWQILSLGDLTRLELLETTGKGSFLEGFLSKKDGGVHHITLQTPDIQKAEQFLGDCGIPYFGRNDYGYYWKELFIHPRDAFGVLIQIAEFNADDWLSQTVKMTDNAKIKVIQNDRGCTISFAHPGGGTVNVDLDREEMIRLRDELNK